MCVYIYMCMYINMHVYTDSYTYTYMYIYAYCDRRIGGASRPVANPALRGRL